MKHQPTPARQTGNTARLAGATAAAAGTGVVAGAAGLWLLAPEPVRASGLGGLGTAAAVILGGGVVAAGGWLTTGWWTRRHLGGARRLVEEVDLIATVNPNHRVSATGSIEVAAVAAAVNRLAGRFWESLSERDAAIARGRAEAERDRERLAALMADLSHGVLVCDTDGRIVLYNTDAHQMLSIPDPDPSAGPGPGTSPGDGSSRRGTRSPVGLGLSVYDALDEGVLASALHRFELDPSLTRPVRFTAIGPAGRLLRASVGPIRTVTDASGPSGSHASGESTGPAGHGFVVVLEDAANEIEARNLGADLVREMLEESRGRLAAIGGAVAMLEDFDDLDRGQVARFRSIISEEAARLSDYLVDVQERHQRVTGVGWERTDIACRDLMRAAQHRVLEATGMEVTVGPDDGLWARVDAAGLIEALTRAVSDLTASGVIRHPAMRCWSYPPFVALGLSWLAEPPSIDPNPDRHQVPGEIAAITRTHGGEAWLHHSDTAELTVLLPTGGVVGVDDLNANTLGAWPTTYDFTLPAHQPAGPPSVDRLLADLPYTAIAVTPTPQPDSELGPAPGPDAADAATVTAVRIVNSRLLPHETFTTTAAAADGNIPGFTDFVGQTVLVSHGPDPAGLLPRPHLQLDIVALADLALGTTTGRSLETLAATLGLAPADRPSSPNTMGSPAALTAEVFLRLLPLLEVKGLRTLGDVTTATPAPS